MNCGRWLLPCFPRRNFGVVSTTPLTSATIAVNSFGGFIVDEGFDNVRIAAANAAVPEPGSVALLVDMASVSGMLLRRRNRK
jgi:hypothetical protein